MFGQNREKKRFSWRWAVLLVSLVAGALVFAACGEPATPTPDPTATPVLTPTPDPTATPVPTPTPAMMSLSDIDETTTGAELIASLSEGEADCLRAAIGDASYEAMQDLTLSESAMGFDTFPLQCLEPDNAIDLSIAMMSLQAGGLSDDSQACIKDVFADLGVPGEGMSMTDSMRSFITMQLCLTDEEAQAMSGPVPEEDAFPLPSQLRCVSEQTDLENLFIVYQAFADLESSTEQPTPSPEMTKAVAEIMAAQETCGIPTIIMMDKDADAMMDKDADAMMDKDADAMMDKDADAMMDKDADAMMDKDADAMMDKDADAMMDKDGDTMMSLSDIDETTTGAELIASLSEGEADCLRAAIGDASYEAMQDLTLSESAMGFDTFPLQCLEPGNAIDLSVAMMSFQAGGLSDDSQACIKDVFADLGVPGEGMSMTDSMRSFITMQLCLTDEEAQAMSGPVPEEDAFPLPSQLRCVSEQTDLENLFIVYQAFADLESSTEQPTPSPEMTKAVAEIMAAQETCGIPTIIQGEGSAP